MGQDGMNLEDPSEHVELSRKIFARVSRKAKEPPLAGNLHLPLPLIAVTERLLFLDKGAGN
jgi:hypothetical protein